MTLDLINSEEAWNDGLISVDDVCIKIIDDEYSRIWESSQLSGSSSPIVKQNTSSAVESLSSETCVRISRTDSLEEGEVRDEEESRVSECVKENDILKITPSKDDATKITPIQEDTTDDDIIEEYVSLAKPTVKMAIKRKSYKNLPSQYVCKVCDRLFSQGTEVSAHVFSFHLQGISESIWQELYTDSNNSLICIECGVKHDKITFAKLHQYTEHKRELKRKMEEKGLDWRNLLDYIQFKVTEDMIAEDEVDSEISSSNVITNTENDSKVISGDNKSLSDGVDPSENCDVSNLIPPVHLAETLGVKENVVEVGGPCSKAENGSDSDDGIRLCTEGRGSVCKKNDSHSLNEKHQNAAKCDVTTIHGEIGCPFLNCRERKSTLSDLVDHYIENHEHSISKLLLMRKLSPDRFVSSDTNITSIHILGEKREVTCCSLCEIPFIDNMLLSQHVANHSDENVTQCEYCRIFIKVEEQEIHQLSCQYKDELIKIENIINSHNTVKSLPPSQQLSDQKTFLCTHRHGGCMESFSGKKLLHQHARKCRFRPNTSFTCNHDGCTKRYYYKQDFERHVIRQHTVETNKPS